MTDKKLLKKFINNQCTLEEAERVSRLLEESPELLEQFLSEKDWNNHIQRTPGAKSSTRIVACIFIFFIGLFGLRPQYIGYSEAPKAYHQYFISNHSDTTETQQLSDGSVAKLSPGAYMLTRVNDRLPLRYVLVFNGEITFQVAKDKHKPFVVENGGLRTTALGTRFLIRQDQAHKTSGVYLEEGKVKVEKINGVNERSYVLLPGEHVTLKAGQSPAFASDNDRAKQRSLNNESKAGSTYRRPSSIAVREDGVYMDNASLESALDFLAQELETPVASNPSITSNYSIVGRFSLPDTNVVNYKRKMAEQILQIIVELNPLTLEKKYNTFIIHTKSQKSHDKLYFRR